MTIPIPSPVSISPIFNDAQFADDNGNPLAGGKIFTYAAGSNSDEQITFTTELGVVANSNPIILDSAGRLPEQIWLANGYAYNLVLTAADGTTVIRTVDNVRGAYPAFASGLGTAIWNVAGVPTYVSPTEFYISGDLTNEFAIGNRVQWYYNNDTYAYGTVNDVTYSGEFDRTYVTLVLDSNAFSDTVLSVAWSSAVVVNYIADAGAVGYTSTFTYTGKNVGTQLQTIQRNDVEKAKTVDAILNGTTYDVTVGFSPVDITKMALDVRFVIGVDGPCYFNVNNVGEPPALKMFDANGDLVDPYFTDGFCGRVMYNGSVWVLMDQLPYLPPPPPAPSFAPTMGTVSVGGTFTVTAGSSGNIAIIVSNYAHALYGNFGQATFNLYANGTLINSASTRFFEWDSRTGGGNPTNVASYNAGPYNTVTFSLTYSGPGTYENPSTWLAITA